MKCTREKRRGCSHAAVLLASCLTLFGPEIYPLDQVTHTELRVLLCTRYNGQHLIVEARTYERERRPDGTFVFKFLSGHPHSEGWVGVKDIPVFVSPIRPPEPPKSPPSSPPPPSSTTPSLP